MSDNCLLVTCKNSINDKISQKRKRLNEVFAVQTRGPDVESVAATQELGIAGHCGPVL